MDLTLDLGAHVLVLIRESDEPLAGLTVQISLFLVLHSQLFAALLQPPKLCHVEQQCWAQVRWNRVIDQKCNLVYEWRRRRRKKVQDMIE